MCILNCLLSVSLPSVTVSRACYPVFTGSLPLTMEVQLLWQVAFDKPFLASLISVVLLESAEAILGDTHRKVTPLITKILKIS